MFIGRVGALTFISAFIFKNKYEGFRYPKEEILF
jgi:Trk-type K+ transport system membrane component